MLDDRNYDPSFGPAIGYAWYTERAIRRRGAGILAPQLDDLAAFPDVGVTKILVPSSVTRLDQLLREEGAALQRSGITVIGYNTEHAVGTPGHKMAALGFTPSNPVARAAALAEAAGLHLIWGPIRDTADRVSDRAITGVVAGGLDGWRSRSRRGMSANPPVSEWWRWRGQRHATGRWVARAST